MQSRGYFVASLLMGLILCVPLTANSAEEQDVTHRNLTGVVVQKAVSYTHLTLPTTSRE